MQRKSFFHRLLPAVAALGLLALLVMTAYFCWETPPELSAEEAEAPAAEGSAEGSETLRETELAASAAASLGAMSGRG